MNKWIILILLFSFNSIVYCQTSKTDTIFLLKEYEGDNYHIIYIDNNKSSQKYNQIANFKFSESDSLYYLEMVEYLKEKSNQNLQKHTISDIPKKWCPLYIYKGKFYLWTPTSFGYNLEATQITDSTWIVFGGEGPTPSIITSFQKTDNKTYKLNLLHYGTIQQEMVIVLVDKRRGIALFNDRLMIDADKIKQFPIIVDESEPMGVYPEGTYPVKFEKPDVNNLLKIK